MNKKNQLRFERLKQNSSVIKLDLQSLVELKDYVKPEGKQAFEKVLREVSDLVIAALVVTRGTFDERSTDPEVVFGQLLDLVESTEPFVKKEAVGNA